MHIRELIKEINMSPSALAKSTKHSQALVGIEYEFYFNCQPYLTGKMTVPDRVLHYPVRNFDDMNWPVRWSNEASNVIADAYRKQEQRDLVLFLDNLPDFRQRMVTYLEQPDLTTEQVARFIQSDPVSRAHADRLLGNADSPTLAELGIKTLEQAAQYLNLEIPGSEYEGRPSLDQAAEILDADLSVGLDVEGRLFTSDWSSFTLTTDGSLEQPNHRADLSLELVTPPLPLDQALAFYKKMVQVLKKQGHYTNQTCGLHVNISLPDIDNQQVDLLKMALLLGDQQVLERFGRTSNRYTNSSMDRLNYAFNQELASGDQAQRLIPQLINKYIMADRAWLNRTLASHFGKYNSMHSHLGATEIETRRVEFRSMGGDWLNSDYQQIANTIMRFVTVYQISADPDAYKSQYYKKLYQAISAQAS